MLRLLRKLNPFAYRPYVEQLLALRAESGAYRFLVRDWRSAGDINALARMLETEYFRDRHALVPLPLEKLRSILAIAPHQDDEAIGAGGALLLASRAGVELDVLYLTDGAQRKAGRLPHEMARVRRAEAQEACSRLGATMHCANVSNVFLDPTPADVDFLAETLDARRPEVVMVPWLLDLPAKHRLVNHVLWLASRRHRLPDFEVWGYQVHNPIFPNAYVDITPVADEKRELIACFRSQSEYCAYDHLAMGMGAWNARFLDGDPRPRYVELFFTLPLAEHLALVERYYFRDWAVTYRNDSDVIRGARALHDEIVAPGGRASRRAAPARPGPARAHERIETRP